MSTLRLDVITRIEQFDALREPWADVFASSADRSAFVTWEWARCWWEHFGARDELHIVTVVDGARVLAIAPFLRARLGVGPARVQMLVGIGQETADYGGALLGDRAEEASPLLLDHLDELIQHDSTVVNFTRLRPDGDLLGLLRARYDAGPSPARLVEEQQSVYPRLDLSLVDDPARHVAKLDKRNDSRRRLRRLREEHDVSFEYDVEVSASAMAELFRLYDARWEQKSDQPSGVFASALGRPFVVDVATALQAREMCRLSFLYADGVPIAGRCGFELDGVYLGYMSAFDPEYSRFGLSTVLVAQILAYEVEHDMQGFDFLRGAAPHKARWVNTEQEIGYWTLGDASPLGRVRRRAMWELLRRRSRRFR